jgi:outer membrane protein TolC
MSLRTHAALGVILAATFAARTASAAGEGAPAAAGAPMHLEDAVQLALTRNERARISDLNVTVAEAAVERARTAFLPVLTAVASDTQHANPTTGPNQVGQATATINQPLVNAPAFPLYAQAKNQANAEHAQNVDDKRLLGFSAASAFFAVLQAQAVVQAATRQLDNAKANFKDASDRVEAKLTGSNDATRAQLDVSAAQREFESDKGLLANALVQLSFVVNAPVAASVAEPGPLLAASRQVPPAEDALVQFALGRRPDMVASKYTAIAAHDFAGEPLLRIVPTLGLQGQTLLTTGNSGTLESWRNDETVTATLTWTLYDAGVRYADKHSRDAQAEIADLNFTQLRRSVEAQVRSALSLLVAGQAAVKNAEDAVKAAQQSVDETSILYKQGLAKAIELVDANDTRFGAEVAYAQAQYGLAQAYMSYRQALGLDALGTEVK